MVSSAPGGIVTNRAGVPSRLILRVYNYYRVLLSFCLVHIYVNVPEQEFIGGYRPELFQDLVLVYFLVNLVLAIACLLPQLRFLSRPLPIFLIFCADIVFFGLLMYSSGGVNSVLGNFLMIPVAFAGAMVLGRTAIAVAAIASLVCLYQETYLYFALGRGDSDGVVQAGILGITFFMINMLFQVLYRQLYRKDRRIDALERVRQLERLTIEQQRALESSNLRLQTLLQRAGDGVLGLEPDGEISFANPRAGQLLGLDHEQLVGQNISRYFVRAPAPDQSWPGSEQGDASHNILEYLELPGEPQGWDLERWQTASDQAFYVEYSCEPMRVGEGLGARGVVVIFQNITERRDRDERLHRLANFDPLTGLANRAYFQHFLQRAIPRAERSGRSLAVLFIDMDNFKYVNDSWGHEGGDDLLVEASRRISGSVRSGDLVTRLGGDEFAVILLDIERPEDAARVAQAIIDRVAEPVSLQNLHTTISVSIGIAVQPAGKGDSSELLNQADAAMYAAKGRGGGSFRFFERDMQNAAEARRRIQKQLETAVSDGELNLIYQPIVELEQGDVRGFEALLRWQPSGSAPVGPAEFIPIAEKSGQIMEIGRWVVDRVCVDARRFFHEHGSWPNISLNISTRQLRTGEFREALLERMRAGDIPPTVLDLELTETGVMEDPEFVLAELDRLREIGLRISIDDFGTGYSSLDYLRRLPLDYLKIDRGFTADIGRVDTAEELIRVMIAIAHTMGLKVIAEGVESEAQREFLLRHGCDFGQGYLFGAPGTFAQAVNYPALESAELPAA